MSLDPSHKARLNWRAIEHFPGDTLFARVARAVCEAGCLPRKELYESWEMARRVRRRFRGGRIIDMAAGHGLLAYICLLLDKQSTHAICVDRRRPPSAQSIADAMEAAWPYLQVEYIEDSFETLPLHSDDVVVSAHACGSLTDDILQLAIDARARVAVLPCCHDLKRCDTGPLQGWLDGPLAIDTLRAIRLQDAGYKVFTQAIPIDITPKNRLLLGQPSTSPTPKSPA